MRALPNANRIISGLYQGAVPPSAIAVQEAGFQTLVLCASEIQPPDGVCGNLRVLRCPLNDDPTVPLAVADWDAAFRVGSSVARRHRSGQRVLVTCAQGRNRSGLVTCIALHLLTGWSGSTCIQHVQRHRHMACRNPQFNAAVAANLR